MKAEKIVRDLSVKYSHVYVITGSIFDENADGLRDEDANITRLVPRLLFVTRPSLYNSRSVIDRFSVVPKRTLIKELTTTATPRKTSIKN